MKKFFLKAKSSDHYYNDAYGKLKVYLYVKGEPYLKKMDKEFHVIVELRFSDIDQVKKRKVIGDGLEIIESSNHTFVIFDFLVPSGCRNFEVEIKLLRKVKVDGVLRDQVEYRETVNLPVVGEKVVVVDHSDLKLDSKYPTFSFNDIKKFGRKYGLSIKNDVRSGLIHANRDCKGLFSLKLSEAGGALSDFWTYETTPVDGITILSAADNGINVSRDVYMKLLAQSWTPKKSRGAGFSSSIAHDVKVLTVSSPSLIINAVGFALIRGNVVLKETAAIPAFNHPIRSSDIKNLPNGFWASGRTKHDNIYHAVLDDAARAWLYISTVEKPGVLYFYDYKLKFCKSILGKIFSDFEVVYLNEDYVYSFERLAMLDTSFNGCASPANGLDQKYLTVLRDSCIPPNTAALHKYIYVCRRDAKTRSLVNDLSLSEALEGIGFTTVVMSDFSPEDQIRLFNSADVIVAQHGAALTNLVFCNSSVSIVELFSPHQASLAYAKIACSLKIAYSAVIGHSLPDGKRGDTSWQVDIDSVIDCVNEYLS